MAKLGNRSMRNLSSAGMSAARFTVGAADKGAVGLVHWAATDHMEFGKALDRMPKMGI